MLAFHLAIALFATMFGRPPRRREHADLRAAVHAAYAHLRRKPSGDPDEVLRSLRASARVREVLDVALDAPPLTRPHSFIVNAEDLAATTQKHRVCVVDGVGCLVYHKKHYYLATATQVKRAALSDVFSQRRGSRAIIVIEEES